LRRETRSGGRAGLDTPFYDLLLHPPAALPGNVNVLLGRLVDAGALYRIRNGEYAYTAPKFRDYPLRTHT